jgi:mannosyl-3-phosphoglycerate phosphatase
MQNMHRLQLKIALYVRAVTLYPGRLTNMKETKAAMGLMFMTDLDGTLLGHEDFSFASIRDDILDLLRGGITLVPNSSKTRQEIDAFCDELGTSLPFICENGAALVNRQLIAPPSTSDSDEAVGLAPECLMIMWDQHIGTSSRRHCHFLADLPEAEQAWHLGLRGAALKLAMARDYSVPFVFTGSQTEFHELQQQAGDADLAIKRGGRVCNLSACHDKVGFTKSLRADYRAARQELVIVGFGDGANDIGMLEGADIACVVPRPGSPPLTLASPPPTVITAQRTAPEGWLDAARQALSILDHKRGEYHG